MLRRPDEVARDVGLPALDDVDKQPRVVHICAGRDWPLRRRLLAVSPLRAARLRYGLLLRLCVLIDAGHCFESPLP
jgi:hypothetical protein